MALPTFLGIGVPRSGTTWLHALLAAHPDVLMATRRKEVQYFNHHHERGLEWYATFFPDATPAPVAVGDFTPGYLFDPAVPARVAAVPSIDRFVVSFRDPIERLVSHYRSRAAQDHFQGSLDEFVDAYPHIVDQGRYATHLERWFETFDREQFLVVIFERAIQDVDDTKARLADHLGLRADRFPAAAGTTRENAGYAPRQPRLHAAGRRLARFLRRHDIDWGHRVGTHLRGERFRQASPPRPDAAATVVSPELRARLTARYRPEAQRLAVLTGQSLDHWPVLGLTADQ